MRKGKIEKRISIKLVDILNETIDEEVKIISIQVQKAMEEKFKAEQEAIQLKLQKEKLQREQQELARKQAEELLVKEQQQQMELERESFVGRTTKKNSRVKR